MNESKQERMKKIREVVGKQVNVNTLMNGMILACAVFALNKADHIYSTVIRIDAWRTEHMEAMGQQSKTINDLSIRLTSDEGKWRATAIEAHSNTVAIKAIERKIGL